MTIAIGFRCEDGIVLCSDREMSTPEYSYYDCKISLVGLADAYFLMAQSAYDADDMTRIYEQISSRISGSAKTLDQIRQDIQEVLTGFKEWNPDIIEHQTLIAIMPSANKYVLWKTANDKISPVLQTCSIIGSGNSALTQYLMATLLRQTLPLTIQQAVIYGIYIIRQAKKYLPGCGSLGPTDVVSFPTKTGNPNHAHAVFINAVETFLDSLETQASNLFSTLIDRRSNSGYNDHCIGQFADFLKVIAEKVKMF
jgi:20S proteasome alpha/beta subunit